MSVEVTTGELRTHHTPNAGGEPEFDWAELHRRLDASHAALQRRLTPSTEEKQKLLRTRARLLAVGGKAEATAPHLVLEVVEFVLGAEHYGIESLHIREIHPLSEFTPLPCTPAFVLGLVNVRGQILSIIDIKKLFDLPDQGLTDLNKVIIVHADHMELGILADAIVGLRSIARERTAACASHPDRNTSGVPEGDNQGSVGCSRRREDPFRREDPGERCAGQQT